MDSGVIDLAINIAAGLLTAIVLWLAQWSLRRRRINRTREFFGLAPDTECLLVVNRHGSSPSENSVHRRDVFALLELAGLIKQCGARAEVVGHDEVRRGFGERAEFSIGGPGSNTRTAAHLEWKLPGVRMPKQKDATELPIEVGDDIYRRGPAAEYVLFAKIIDGEHSRPVFLICGQTAVTNQAAVRYLVAHDRKLARKYGTKKSFCVLLKVINPSAYGPDVVEWVDDVTEKAFNPKPAADPKQPAETVKPAVKSAAKPAGEPTKPAAGTPTPAAATSPAATASPAKPAAAKPAKATKAPAKSAAKPATTTPAKAAAPTPAKGAVPQPATPPPARPETANPPTQLRPASAAPSTTQPGTQLGNQPGNQQGTRPDAQAGTRPGSPRAIPGGRDTE